MKKISGALISVYYKDGLAEIVQELDKRGVTIYSTGGTQAFIEELGIKAEAVEELTSYPSILGGRVKTLHPKVFGGILARRANEGDIAQLAEYAIPEIDLVIVDLYPFEQTVADTAATEQEIIEKIDIGGISLIRAAAKNFKDVAIVPSVAQYGYLLELLKTQEGATTLEQRRHLAAEAFNVSSNYDTAIFNYFNRTEDIAAFKQSYTGAKNARTLRYGENPHQTAAYYGNLDAQFEQLWGKEISYNNLLDMDAAANLVAEFGDKQAAFVIMKHNNACGVAVREKLVDAWSDALAGDPVSAFGGVLATNRPIDRETAEKINDIFFEVIMAPEYESKALEILKTKKNRIILQTKVLTTSPVQFRSLLGGVAVQQRDSQVGGQDTEMQQVTQKGITEAERKDLLFANRIVKHSKSNAIVLARNGMLLASGIGQTSRVDALKQAIAKAHAFGFDLKGAALASDAFFPFADCAEIAHAEGIDTLIQPGGSMRDQETIDYCNANGMAMVFTGLRHFKH